MVFAENVVLWVIPNEFFEIFKVQEWCISEILVNIIRVPKQDSFGVKFSSLDWIEDCGIYSFLNEGTG